MKWRMQCAHSLFVSSTHSFTCHTLGDCSSLGAGEMAGGGGLRAARAISRREIAKVP